MPQKKPFNLFVYGTLRDPWVFRAVVGLRLVMHPQEPGDESVLAREAVLAGYKKISPDHTYLYAVPSRHGRIVGYLIGPLPGESLRTLRKYEGENYSRRRVTVTTATGSEQALVFVGNVKKLEHVFGYAFRDPFKQEVLLQQKIDKALLETERAHLHTDEAMTRQAVGELHGPKIRDLVRRHFEAGGISDYAIRHSLLDAPLRDYTEIIADNQARALAPNYLRLVVRQVIFNKIEKQIHRDFRYELDRMTTPGVYYERTISCLAALRIVNARPHLMDALVAECLADLRFEDSHLVDFVRWGISAADAIYDAKLAGRELQYIRTHLGRGYVPMGAELEFSDIGHDVIRDPESRAVCDARYDGFFYFREFGLDMLTWKLGGHIDDHHYKWSDRPRRGFFETALGNVSIEANLSKPVTDDPWLLNQFIHATRRFYPIGPHSVHISLQRRTRHRPVRDNVLPLPHMKCLFALGGDPARNEAGQLEITRLASDEILDTHRDVQMLFSEISRRRSSDGDEGHSYLSQPHRMGRNVQQFKFLRLSPTLNYEVIVMALKGLQIHHRPGTFLTAAQFEESRKHRRLLENLRAWGENPDGIGPGDIEAFLTSVYKGLMTERRGKPAHRPAYISWAMNQLREMLHRFNKLTETSPLPAEA